jgi:hypothetical protein
LEDNVVNQIRRNCLSVVRSSSRRRSRSNYKAWTQRSIACFEQLEDRVVPTVINLTTPGASGMINGAFFNQFTQQPAGSGTLNSFVKLSTPNTIEQGFNTDFRPVQFNEDNTPTFTRALKLASVPKVIAQGGVAYYEFLLDINQLASASLLSLDELRLYVTNPSTVDPNLLHNYNSTTHTLQDDAGALYSPAYDLNPTSDINYIELDAKLSSGNGAGDMVALIPVSMLGTDLNQYVYLYSELGVHFANNDGADEWAVATLPTGSISGSVFIDTNFNGVRDTGEPGQAGVTVYLDVNNSGIFVPGVDPSTVTSPTDGSFSFSNLLPGTYHVREVLPAEYAESAQINADVNLTSGQNFAGVQFGNFRTGIVTLVGTTLVVRAQLGSQYTRTDGSTGIHGSNFVVSGTQSQFTFTVTDVAAGAGGANAVYTFNSQAFSPNITVVDLVGRAGDDSFDGRNFTGNLESDSGGGRDAMFGSSTGSNTYSLGLHATGADQISIVAPSTATNSLSFTQADQNVTFDLGQLNGTAQTVTASGDTVSYTGAITNYFTSNFNDQVFTPGANNQTFTAGTGNSTFTINPTSSGSGNSTFTVNNSSFTGGSGNNTFTFSGTGTGNNTFTFSGSAFNLGSGNSTFTLSAGTGNNTFTLNNSTFGGTGNNTFNITSPSLTGNDKFNISGTAFNTGTGNNNFTITADANFSFDGGSINAGSGNNTFTINGSSQTNGNTTFAISNSTINGGSGNNTFTVNGSGSGNNTFTVNGSVGGGTGNGTFTLNATGSANNTFSISGAVTGGSGTGNNTFSLTGTGSGNNSFSVGSLSGGGTGNNTFTLGSSGTGNSTFTVGSVTGGAGNNTFTLTGGGGGNTTFTIAGGVSGSGSGNSTFTLANSGSGTGNTTFTVNSSFTGGSGNNAFTLEDTGTAAGTNNTFTVGGNYTAGGSGNNTFAITGGTASGNTTFTLNGSVTNGGSGNNTFTVGSSGTGNDTFKISGSVTGGTGNNTFTVGSTGTGNDTFSLGSLSGGGNGNNTFTLGSSGTGNDTFSVSSMAGGTGSNTFTLTAGGGGNDSFTITGGVTAAGATGNTSFILNNSGTPGGNSTFTVNSSFTGGSGNNTFSLQDTGTTGNNTFTVNGNYTAGGTGNNTFTVSGSSGTGNTTFTMTGSVTNGGSGNNTFTVGSNGGGNDTFKISGSVTGGTGSNTFTVGSTGSGNDTFSLGSLSGGGNGNNTFTLGSSGTGNDTFSVSSMAGGTGSNTFTLTAGGGGNDSFTITGGVSAAGSSGNNTFMLTNSGSATGNTTFIVTSNFTGGSGNNTFTLQDTGTGASNDTFTVNGSYTAGGSGNDTFSVSGGNSAGNNTFTFNGSVASGGSGSNTFTVGSNGSGNTTFTVTGSITSNSGNNTFTVGGTGNGNDTFALGSVSTSGSSGSNTFTVGSSGTGNDTFTVARITGGSGNNTFVITSGGGGNDTFTATGGVGGTGNNTFVVSGTGAANGNTTLTVNSNFTGGNAGNQFFIQDTGTGASNDTFKITGNLTGGNGNDSFAITNNSNGNNTFTVNGALSGGGSGNDTFTVNNAGTGNNTFTVTGPLSGGGSGNSTFVVSNTGNGNDSFTLGGGVVGGSGQDIVTINAVGNGNDSYAINGPVSLGNANFSFFTISADGSGSNSFSVTGPVTAGNGDDFFDVGATGTGTDNFTFGGAITFGSGTDSFQIGGSGTGTEIYNFQGGISGNGYDTYTINDPGSASGAEALTVNGNLGGGAGNNTFIITSGLQTSVGTSNFTLNGNLVGGAGYNAFSITNSGNPANGFTLNGGLVGGTNDVGDTFELAGAYQNVSLTAGTGAGADTFMFAGAATGNFSVHAPNQTNRSDTVDFSTLSSGINLDISKTTAQQVTTGLTIQLSDSNGITGVVGTTFGDTIHGNGRADLLRGSNILDPNYQATAPGPGANGKVQVVLLDFDTAYQQAGGVYDFNSYYGRRGVTPLHVYTAIERQGILNGLKADYAPYVQSGSIYFTMSQTDAVAHAGGNTYITEYFDKTAVGGESGSVGAGTNVVAVGNSNDLDFRDVDMTGTGTIQLNGLLGEPLQPSASSQNWIYLSTKIAAHELGHLLGLHHADAFGAIGQGLLPLPGGADYNPPYAGPHNAGETFNHIISSGDTVGFDSWNNIRGLFFGEREDVVLAYAFTAPSAPADGTLLVAQHGSPTQASPQQLTLMPMTVPNTDLYGLNAGKTFEVQAVDVIGHIGLDATGHAEQDFYSFTGNQGDVMNINVMSAGITRYFSQGTSSYIDADAYLYQKNSDGSLTLLAHNDDVFPNSAPGDASFTDFVLPTTGTYVVKVTSFAFAPGQPHPDPNDPSLTPDERQNLIDAINNTDTGNYELFLYRFKAGVTSSGNDTYIPGSGAATIVGGSGTNPIVAPAAMNINTLEFVPSSGTPIASFTDSGNPLATNYSASIDWGDNSSPSAGTISVNGHAVTVLGGHTYNQMGTYTVTVTLNQGPSTTVKLTSTATAVGRSIIVLNPSASGALSMSGGATINVGGAVVVDSNSPSAITLTGSGQVQASAIEVVGGIGHSSSTSFIPGVTPLTSPLPDPFALLTGPSTTGMTNYGAFSLGGTSSQTINPGIYTSIRVSNSATLTMNPGVYIIEGGGFTVTSGGSVTGTGVMIYNAGSNYPNSGGTFGGISLNGSGSFNLAAPTSGPYAGIVIFQSRENTRALSLGGGTIGGLSGAIYAANALLSLGGGGHLQNGLVVGTLSLSGTVGLSQTAAGIGATGAESAVAGSLLAGNLNVYISNPGGYFTADMLARVQDAITGIDTLLVPYGVTINEVSDPSQANVVLDNGTTSASGSAADGVLGSFVATASGAEITILQGWNWYAGTDPTQVGSGQYDFQTTVTHELGHALGLGHSPNLSSPMYATLATGTANRTLTVPDLNIPDPPTGAEPLRAAGFSVVDATPVAMPGQNGEFQVQPTQGDFTVGLVNGPNTNVVVSFPPNFGPISAVAGWTDTALTRPKQRSSALDPANANWPTLDNLREAVFESLGKELQMGGASLQPQEATVKMSSQAANGLGTETVRMQASRVDQPSGRRAAQQDLETNEIGFVAEAGIDWFMVAGAVTAMALPSQAGKREDTERLFTEWTRRKNGAR